jgi:hypothetical protein
MIAPAPELLALRTACAVRERCALVYTWVAEGRSPHFVLDESRLGDVATYVADVTRENYPDLGIPYHSRWRHFTAGGIDRWGELAAHLPLERAERARAAIDLATVSVLLDAGAGAAWRYREPGAGCAFARSEGLAVASLDMFRAGAFSSDPHAPCRVDAAALVALDPETLRRGFQVSAANPLVGLEGRADLLHRLGRALAARADLFGRASARPGNLVDALQRLAPDGKLGAAAILDALLDGLSDIWPSGLVVDGVPLGDAGRHPAVRTRDPTDGIVPFHKLSQWLAYSLLEPLQAAGLEVTGLDQLTGLPEYRNGGLFIDLGVIRPRRLLDSKPHAVDSEPIVEWRALTVILIDRLLPLVRSRLGLDAASLPLASLLQGGTWAAGRRIAQELRPPDGPPPLAIVADGTVF